MPLVFAASAQAGIRYAAPSPTGSADCSSPSNACDIDTAVESPSVNDGDEVILASGDYTPVITSLIGLDVTKAIIIRGAAGQPRPRITSSADFAVKLEANPGAQLRDVAIEHTGATGGLLMLEGAGTAERVAVHTSTGLSACSPAANSLIRDSTCWNTTATGSAIELSLGCGAPCSDSGRLRNVTAVGAGAGSAGILLDAGAGPAQLTLTAKNVITQGGVADVRAVTTDSGASSSITLDHSNYETIDSDGVPGNENVTDPGSGTNQISPPLFANAAAGNFHQLAGSPTIDRGANDFLNGAEDIDGNARVLDGNDDCQAVTDIGGDEFVDPTPPDCSPPPPGGGKDTTPPETTIDKGPKKKIRKRKAKFRFSSDDPEATFECKLDKAEFEPCMSPQKYKHLKRKKHRFEVRAIDQAGNVDATPDKLKWKVKKKR